MSERRNKTEQKPTENLEQQPQLKPEVLHAAADAKFVEAVYELLAILQKDEAEEAGRLLDESGLQAAVAERKPVMQRIEKVIADTAEAYGLTSPDDVAKAMGIVHESFKDRSE